MAMASSCARSFLRSTSSFRNAASKLASEAKPARSFRIADSKPLPNHIFRSPAELSCCVDSLMPFHTVTASALLTSMLPVTRPGCSWLLEDS